MTKGAKNKADINKNPPNPNDISMTIDLNRKEVTYFERLASVMSKITAQDNGKLLPDKSFNSLGKMALGMLTHVSLTQVLVQSELARTLPDKEALNEFIAFRRDYMNFPVDKQIADLKRVGVVK
ncbi:MAG: hypothetical protein ACRD6U_00420 [Nitrososphaeraceae archaeon]